MYRARRRFSVVRSRTVFKTVFLNIKSIRAPDVGWGAGGRGREIENSRDRRQRDYTRAHIRVHFVRRARWDRVGGTRAGEGSKTIAGDQSCRERRTAAGRGVARPRRPYGGRPGGRG